MQKPKVIVAAIASAATISAAFLIPGCRHTAGPDNAIHLNGRIESATVDLAPKVAGRVTEIRVREGDRVKAGDLLLRLDLGETSIAVEREQAAVRSAEARVSDLQAGSRGAEIAAAEAEVVDRRAAVQLATKEEERQEFLLARRVGTPQDFDRAQTPSTPRPCSNSR